MYPICDKLGNKPWTNDSYFWLTATNTSANMFTKKKDRWDRNGFFQFSDENDKTSSFPNELKYDNDVY